MSPEAVAANEVILTRVEEIGGGFVWESEIFAVSLMDVAVSHAEASKLCGLSGVQQIALNASLLSLPALRALASITGLESLVLTSPSVATSELAALESIGPRIEVVSNET